MDKEQVQALWERGLTVTDIYKKLKTAPSRVTDTLESLGITHEMRRQRGIESNRRPPSAEVREGVRQDWQKGATYRELTDRYGISDHYITQIINKLERPTRKRNRVIASRCCACTILLTYAGKSDTIFCEDCSYLECGKRKREVGVMCEDCQKHLNVEPRHIEAVA